MPINVEIKVVPFGQLRLETGKLIPSAEKPQSFPAKEDESLHGKAEWKDIDSRKMV